MLAVLPAPKLPAARPIREISGLTPRDLGPGILESTEPIVLRGLVAAWPMVQAARQSAGAADAYLRRFYRDAAVNAMLGPPEIEGRFFYNEAMDGFNFAPVHVRLDKVLAELERYRGVDPQQQPAIYVGSTTIDTCLPGFHDENRIDLDGRDALGSIWIGNRTRIAAHYDLPDNLACVVAGRRRFTLFPPSQVENLYIGPLDLTPAGQAISLVDFLKPDLERFPRFATAMEHALAVEMEPGDALFIPSMWWHHIQALEDFNVLVNYWWRQSPGYMDTPMNALMHALMSVRDLPLEQRKAWAGLFRHYVFEADEETAAHIPQNARRALAPMDADSVRSIRAQLLKRMNR